MADQGRWFKLWCASLTDPHLSNLDISDFGRWCKLGAYIKEHGEQGEITLNPPSRTFCFMMQISAFHELHDVFLRLPNITVSNSVSNTVSSDSDSTVSLFIKIKNWHKYQGDLSTHRVKRYRDKKSFHETENETPKKRREERRGEESNKPPLTPLKQDCISTFNIFWNSYPKKIAKDNALRVWKKITPTNSLVEKIMRGLEKAKTSDQWRRDNGKYIPHPATWLNGRRWDDEYIQETITSMDSAGRVLREI